MPTVPKAPRPQVALNPLPGARLTAAETPESQGAGIAEAEGQIGGALAGVGAKTAALGEDLYTRQQLWGDKVANLSNNNALLGKANELRTRALATQGQAAFDQPERTSKEFNDFADSLEAKLSRPEQKLAFQQMRADHDIALKYAVSSHTNAEMQQFQRSELDNLEVNSRNAAIASGDPTFVKAEIQRQTDEIHRNAPDLGFGPEQVKERIAKATSATLVGVIEKALADGRTGDARKYLASNRDQIQVEQLARLEKGIAEGDHRSAAQKQFDAIYNAGGTEREQLDKARQIEDPDVRDKTTEYLVQRHGIDKQMQKEDHESALRTLYDQIDKNPDVSKIAPTAWVSLTGADRTALIDYARKRSKGEPIETNWQAYDVLNRLSTSQDTDDLQKFGQMNLVQYKGLLADGDLRHFLEVQGAIRKGDFSGAKALVADEAVQARIVDENLASIGVNPKPPEPGKDGYDKVATDRVRAYRLAVRDAVAAREAHTKKKITEPEMQDIADSLMAQTAAEKTHWFAATEPTRYAFETPDTAVTRSVDIPARERTQIETALKKAGLPISETAIVNLFNQHLQAVRGKPR